MGFLTVNLIRDAGLMKSGWCEGSQLSFNQRPRDANAGPGHGPVAREFSWPPLVGWLTELLTASVTTAAGTAVTRAVT